MAGSLKPYTSIAEQIELLNSRGMVVDEQLAEQWLQRVGYYRLSAYWYPYRVVNNAGRSDDFVTGTTFDDVAKLYEFDRKFRTLLHDGIERIEVSLRTELIETFGAKDPLAYKKSENFRPTFEHQHWLETVNRRVDRARRHSEAIRHYDRKYSGELPIWVLTDVLDFSDLSRLYEALPAREQWAIAESMGISIDLSRLTPSQQSKVLKNHPLARWFEQLTIVRNTSAHHGRVWNRSYVPVSTAGFRTISKFEQLPTGQSEKIFGALIVMGELISQVSPGSSWSLKVDKLIGETFSELLGRSTAEMGFPVAKSNLQSDVDSRLDSTAE